MNDRICPICGSSECSISRHTWYHGDNDLCANKIKCGLGYEFIVHDDVNYGDPVSVKKRYNLIYSILLQTPTKNIHGYEYPIKFFYEECSVGETIIDLDKVNLANDMRNYPKNILDRVDRCLINLSRCYPYVGENIEVDIDNERLFFCESDSAEEEILGIYSFLQELGYIEEKHHSIYIISANGWKRIYELNEREKEIQQGFIAMSFSEEAKPIGQIFEKTISRCGYIPRRIDHKEHNNQIVPEIFFEISRSKFLVVDVTYPNYGAYYEAGYGEALKKQVIVCCRNDVFNSDNRPHFDIAQKSAVIWSDEKDLEEKLFRRIEATVGLN